MEHPGTPWHTLAHHGTPSCAWKDNRCRVGLILGTGTNACYLEDVKNIETLDQQGFSEQDHMVVNTEWGAFGDNGELDFIKTKWDENVSLVVGDGLT